MVVLSLPQHISIYKSICLGQWPTPSAGLVVLIISTSPAVVAFLLHLAGFAERGLSKQYSRTWFADGHPMVTIHHAIYQE